VKYLKAYEAKGNIYEPKDIFSVLGLHSWLVLKRLEEAKIAMPNGVGLADIKLWGGNNEEFTTSTDK